MPNIKSGKNCSGCTACFAVCPKDAITMQPDVMGFKYPIVNTDKCIECGLCEKVCSFNDHYPRPLDFEKPLPYGVRLKDISEVMKSRSGGAFVAFSDHILEQDGIIYGVGFRDGFVVEHQRAENKEKRDRFRGSKYVQSDLSDVFIKIKKDLETRKVLFSGTPCQVAGLKSFIPKRLQDNLFTVDIVCHGVPSPFIWRDYLEYIKKRENKEIIGVNFRDKKLFGWKAHKETFELRDVNKKVIEIKSNDTFTNLFYQHIMLRPSCGNCKFCNLKRPSDLTLADFWGWEKTESNINKDDKGLSLILINSEKGQDVFDKVRYQFKLISPELKDCLQPCLERPYEFNPQSVQFTKDYQRFGFKYILFRYSNIGPIYKLQSYIRRIGRKIKRMLKIS